MPRMLTTRPRRPLRAAAPTSHLWAFALLLLGVGCAASVQGLIRNEQFPEAACRADDGGDEAERALVLAELRRRVDPRVHLWALSNEELAQQVGATGETPSLSPVLVLGHRLYPSRSLHDVEVRYAIEVHGGGSRWQPMQSGSTRRWAVLTRESVPPGRVVVTPGQAVYRRSRQDLTACREARGSLLRELGRAMGILPSMDCNPTVAARPERRELVGPSRFEMAAAAPIANALRHDFPADRCGQRLDRACAGFHAHPLVGRSPDTITVAFSYRARPPGHPTECQLEETLAIELPPGRTVGSRLAEVFASGAASLSELEARPGVRIAESRSAAAAFAREQPPEYGRLLSNRMGHVVEVDGDTDVENGQECSLVLRGAGPTPNYNCQAEVWCGSRLVYGGDNGGFLMCDSVHVPRTATDDGGTEDSSDPFLTVELLENRVVVRDDRPREFSVTIALEPFRR